MGCVARVTCGFFSAKVAEDVQLAATLTPDGPVQLIIDFVTPKINLFLSHLLSLSLPTVRFDHPILPSPQSHDREVSFRAPSSLGLVRLSVTVPQRRCVLQCGSTVPVTDSLDAAVGPSLFHTRG
jgi:hypothetical protein